MIKKALSLRGIFFISVMLKDRFRNIIVVDDDPVTIQLCNMLFKRIIPSAKVFVFENGLQAIEWIHDQEGTLIQEGDFVLFLDLNMPVLDGWRFLSYFQKLDEHTRDRFSIYILTSSIGEIDIERSMQFDSVKGFYSKPLTRTVLEELFALPGVPK